MPGESFFSAALENDPTLIEFGLDHNVVLATPTTLIALLRTASYGWQQESLARNAAEISAVGKELYRRISGMIEHWTKVGVNLSRAVHAYNSASASLESRVLVSARKFEDLKTSPIGMEIKAVVPIERAVRILVEGPVNAADFEDVPDIDADAHFEETASADTNGQALNLFPTIAEELKDNRYAPDSPPPEPVKDGASAPWWQQSNSP